MPVSLFGTPSTRAEVIDLRDDPRPPALTEAKLRQIRFMALAALVALNIADLLTTRAFLSAGAQEGNPLADILLGRGAMPFIKGAILIALGCSVHRSKPKLSTTCAMWFVVGVYTTAIVVNLMALAQAT